MSLVASYWWNLCVNEKVKRDENKSWKEKNEEANGEFEEIRVFVLGLKERRERKLLVAVGRNEYKAYEEAPSLGEQNLWRL